MYTRQHPTLLRVSSPSNHASCLSSSCLRCSPHTTELQGSLRGRRYPHLLRRAVRERGARIRCRSGVSFLSWYLLSSILAASPMMLYSNSESSLAFRMHAFISGLRALLASEHFPVECPRNHIGFENDERWGHRVFTVCLLVFIAAFCFSWY